MMFSFRWLFLVNLTDIVDKMFFFSNFIWFLSFGAHGDDHLGAPCAILNSFTFKRKINLEQSSLVRVSRKRSSHKKSTKISDQSNLSKWKHRISILPIICNGKKIRMELNCQSIPWPKFVQIFYKWWEVELKKKN